MQDLLDTLIQIKSKLDFWKMDEFDITLSDEFPGIGKYEIQLYCQNNKYAAIVRENGNLQIRHEASTAGLFVEHLHFLVEELKEFWGLKNFYKEEQ